MEQPLPPFGSCNLGSINLSKFVYNNEFNFDKFEKTVRNCVRFLDNVGVVNKFPSNNFALWYEQNRPIGLGIMGLADLFLMLEIKYGSIESINLTENIFKFMQQITYDESFKLGKERGIPDRCKLLNRRNITTLTVAPTGSIAHIAGCLGYGCEPVFSASYIRTDERGEQYESLNPYHKEAYFVSANNLTWKEHLDIQIILQKYVDSSISKTINLPNTATVEDVKNAFLYAWENNCKGITVYRDNSRNIQVLKHKEPEESKNNPFNCLENGCKIEHKEGCVSCSICGNSACSV